MPASTPRPADPPRPDRGYHFGGIDRLVLTLGRVTYSDLAHPENNGVLELDVHEEIVRDLRTPEDVKRWLTALLVRVAIQDYLVDPARSRSRLYDMLVRGLKRLH